MDGRAGKRIGVRVAGDLAVTFVIVALLTRSSPVVVWMLLEQRVDSARAAVLLPDSADALVAVQVVLGERQAARLASLSDWPVTRLGRLLTWLEYGIRFEGPWASDELALVVGVLDKFGATYGESRVVELAVEAVEDASFGLLHTLRLVRVDGTYLPAAIWYGWAGCIRFNNGLFDDLFIDDNYNWGFLTGEHAHPGPTVARQDVIIGHELGHALTDGLRAEMKAAGYDRSTPEALYEQLVPPEQWPHPYCATYESLATEFSVWAFGVPRTQQANAFRLAMSQYFPAMAPSTVIDLAISGTQP